MMIGLPATVNPGEVKPRTFDRLPVLEDPDEGAEAGGDRQQGHHDRLQRDHDRAEQQEQDQAAREERDPDRVRHGVALADHEVVALGREPADRRP